MCAFVLNFLRNYDQQLQQRAMIRPHYELNGGFICRLLSRHNANYSREIVEKMLLALKQVFFEKLNLIYL